MTGWPKGRGSAHNEEGQAAPSVMAAFVLSGRWREAVAPRQAFQKAWLQSESSVPASSVRHGREEPQPTPGGRRSCAPDA